MAAGIPVSAPVLERLVSQCIPFLRALSQVEWHEVVRALDANSALVEQQTNVLKVNSGTIAHASNKVAKVAHEVIASEQTLGQQVAGLQQSVDRLYAYLNRPNSVQSFTVTPIREDRIMDTPAIVFQAVADLPDPKDNVKTRELTVTVPNGNLFQVKGNDPVTSDGSEVVYSFDVASLPVVSVDDPANPGSTKQVHQFPELAIQVDADGCVVGEVDKDQAGNASNEVDAPAFKATDSFAPHDASGLGVAALRQDTITTP